MSDSDSEYDISNAIASFREQVGQSNLDDEPENFGASIAKKKPSAAKKKSRFGDDSDSDDEDFFKNLPRPSSGGVSVAGNDGSNKKKINPGKFNALGLSTLLVKNVHRKGYNTPTPIQRKTIPLVLDGLDVVGMARTGSGKTAAFVLPMIDKLKAHSAKVGARAVILSPSRELALQTLKVVKDFSKGTDLKCVLLVGGDSLEEQFSWMMGNPDIIIATPGRFLHLKVEMDLDLRSVEYIVFDEADRLFELGFQTQLSSILANLPPTRQTLLFSATLPKSLVEFARAGLTDPVLVRLDADTKVSDELELFFFSIKSAELDGSLVWLLRSVINMPIAQDMPRRLQGWKSDYSDAEDEHNGNNADDDDKKKQLKKKKKKDFVTKGNEATSPHATIIFTQTKHHVEYVTFLLRAFGYAVSYIYGSLDQHARRDQLAQFRAGYTSILVVTDVAARGIDIPILANVVNYAFPGSPKVFVHRVGRTARAGKRGRAFSLIKESELPYLLDLELFLGKPLQVPSQLQGKAPEEIDFTKLMAIGSFPRDELERSCEDVQNALIKDFDLQSMLQVAVKGEKLYLKTRGSASKESVKRAKEVAARGWDLLNPLFNSHKLVERETMLERLSKFRPSETIFELTRKGGVNAESSAGLMKRRRIQVAPIQKHAKKQTEEGMLNHVEDELADDDINGINNDEEQAVDLSSANEDEVKQAFRTVPELNGKRKRAEISSTSTKKQKSSFRDDSHYISHYAPSEMAQDRGFGVNIGSTSVTSFMDGAASASFDLVNEDPLKQGSGIIGSNRTKFTKWDSKKKKYITRNAFEEDATKGGKKGKMIRGENGVRLPASYKSGRFESWKAANKKSKSSFRVGDFENAADSMNLPGRGEKRYRHQTQKQPKAADKYRDDFRNRQKRVNEAKTRNGGFGAQSELKSTFEIRKARNLKDKRREKNARPSRKGRK
ncbi:P-loop containing nucleoside triphosphate hydrolase protein [Lipomyces japonicus]|uniref:P-loop containing nucleoside triphosphate hydrolase protein n=1 Tax=Lipomyces japonicus TaxID=56871 RepID=UPI0034CE9DDD